MAKKAAVFALIVIYVVSIIVAGEASARLSSKSLQPSSRIKHYEFFTKYQRDINIEVPVRDNFLYVPGLNEAFFVQSSTLFKITIQTSFYLQSRADIFVQALVNDYIIIGNKLVPNTAQRVDYGVGNNLYEIDIIGGYLFSENVVVPVTRVAVVYLRPGVYSFNVGVRAHHNKGSLLRSMVTYELIQYEDEEMKRVGNYNLTSIF